MVWYDSGVWKCTLFSPSDDMDCMDYYVWYGMVWYAQNCMNFESGGGFFLWGRLLYCWLLGPFFTSGTALCSTVPLERGTVLVGTSHCRSFFKKGSLLHLTLLLGSG